MSPFTPGELSVMRLLWEHGEMKPSEIQARFREPIKNPALRSYLTILLDKGHVTRRKVGKAFYYQAATPRESAFRRTLRGLIDSYCGGSTEALLLNLIRSEKLTAEELLALSRLAEEPEAGKTPEKAPAPRKPTAKKPPPARRRRRK